MKRHAVLVLLAAVVVSPAAATHNYDDIRHEAKHRYWDCRRDLGPQPCGRHIIRDGWKERGEPARAATLRQVARWSRRLHVLVHPPVVVAPPTPTASTTSTSAGSAGGAEAFVGCESGGDWNAVNPTSGARGRYQIMPFHYTSGVCQGLDWSPSGQQTCAGRIMATQGSGAWSQCGG